MADYGVLSAIRSVISCDEDMISHGLGDKVYLAYPPESDPPVVLVELEEIWTSLKLGTDCGHARLKIKASVFTGSPMNKEGIKAADTIRNVIDGKTIIVNEGMRATIRLSNSVIEMPKKAGTRLVEQYYEVLVRG